MKATPLYPKSLATTTFIKLHVLPSYTLKLANQII